MLDWCTENIQRLLFPPHCCLCSQPGQWRDAKAWDICPACEADLVVNDVACPRCALPVASPGLCASCLKRPPPQTSAWAAYRYHYPLNRLVADFKFESRLAHGRLMAQLFWQAFTAEGRPEVDLIVPVPLHPQRLHERGFNQSLALLEQFRSAGLPVDASLVSRSRATEAQSSLDLVSRRRNLKGAFTLSTDLRGQRVAVVDDVMTSGTTVSELAATLRRAGASEVHVWVLARAAFRRRS